MNDYVLILGIFFTILCFVLLFLPFFLILFKKNPTDSLYIRFTIYTIGLFACFIAMSFIFWQKLYPEYDINSRYIKTIYETNNINQYHERCCDITKCSCAETIYDSCSTYLKNLEEHECDNGYKCCNNITACNQIFYCQQSCTYSANNSRCFVKCGNCKTIILSKTYIDNNNFEDIIIIKKCPRDDLECYNNIINLHGPIGKKMIGYYHQNNPYHIVENYNYTKKYLIGVFVPFWIYFLIIVITMIDFFIKK